MRRFPLFSAQKLGQTLISLFLPILLLGMVGGPNLGCSRQAKLERTEQSENLTDSAADLQPGQMLITNVAGNPIPGARIMIGSRKSEPFAGNIIVTDKNGRVQIPSAWSSLQPVTIEAAGYVRTTYFARTPSTTLHLKIKPRPVTDSSIEMRGQTEGYGEIRNDGFLELGLVLPTMSRGQLPALHVTDVFAREVDTLAVLGNQQRIPSNLAVPTQTKSHIIPIRFSKPVYRQFFPAAGNYRVEAVHARVNISEMIGELRRGASILELVNKFVFTKAAVRPITVMKGITQTNLPLNDFALVPTLDYTAPSFGDNLDLFTIVMANHNGDYFISDIKKLAAGQHVKLNGPNVKGVHGILLNMMRPRTKDAGDALRGPLSATMSLTLSAPAQTKALSFLEIAPAPVRTSPTRLTLSPPRSLSGLSNSMTHVLLSKVEQIGADNYKLEKTSPEWELYVKDWTTNVDLPELPSGSPTGKAGQMRWEVSFVAEPEGMDSVPGPESFEKATHVSRSAVDF